MNLREALKKIKKASELAANYGDGKWTVWDIAPYGEVTPSVTDYAIATILNAVADGTLSPSDQSVKVKPLEWEGGVADTPFGNIVVHVGLKSTFYGGMQFCAGDHEANAKAAAQADYEKRIRSALIPADSVFQVKDGYEIDAFNLSRSPKFGKHFRSECVPLSEALETRSADDVRREALEEAINRLRHEREIFPNIGYDDAIEWIESLIDTPQPKGGDDE